MSTKVGITAENYQVKENVERDTSDGVTGLNQQQKQSDGLKIEGLALPFGKRSRNGVVYEKESVKEAAESLVGCSLLFNHDEDNPIGHIEDVEITDEGLKYFGDLNEEKRETDSLKRGDIPHVSIQATIKETMESETQGKVAVNEFLEMSAVTIPGFSSTDVEASEETVMIEKLMEDNKTKSIESLENPKFEIGDFLRWDFAGGSAEGEVYDMKTEVGDSMSAGGNSFTIEEGDGPLYKLQEWDDEEEEFTNAVVKFEDALREVERPDAAPETAPRNESVKTEQNWKVHTPAYDEAVLTAWDGVDRSEFDSDSEFRSVHVVEHGDEVHLPVAHKEDGVLKLVYEGLNSAFDLAENVENIPDQTVDNARDVLQIIREDEFPDQPALDADSSEKLSEVFEFSPVPSHVLYDNKNDALQRAKDLGLSEVHKHVLNDKEFWMAGSTHKEWNQAIRDELSGSSDRQEDGTSKEPFAGFDSFEDCKQTMMDEEGHDEDSAEKICGALKKKNEIKAVNEALEDVDLTPPDKIKNAAQAALDWEEKNPDRTDCGTGVGDSRANSITNETLSPEDFLGGENTAIPDYLESHEEDVTAEGPPTDWNDEEMNDCGNRQYAKWGFYLDWFKQKEQELKEAREEAKNNINGDTVTEQEQNISKEQLQQIEEDDFTGTVADMYEEVSASDAANLMEDFTFSPNPEPIIALAADAMDMQPTDLMDMAEGTHGDMEDDEEDEAGDMDDEDDDMEESESFNKNESDQSESQDGDNSVENKSKEELQKQVEELQEAVMELEETEPSKQEAANSSASDSSDDSYLSDEFKNRVLNR